jgi:hypothetical protein
MPSREYARFPQTGQIRDDSTSSLGVGFLVFILVDREFPWNRMRSSQPRLLPLASGSSSFFA